ncbi:MAG: type VI secretion system tip protein VgrG [Myxococcales bacterium]|nr:type VI secretion system tip protein VgrG [Myxococcales bacterium]
MPTVTRYTFTARDVAAPLHVRRVDLRERLSQPYALTLELLTADADLDPDALLGAACKLTIAHSPGPARDVHGLVLRVETLDHDEHLRHLRLEVGPALALLTHRVDTRLWQHTSVPDIVKDVLEDSLTALGRRLRLDLSASYPPRETCTQYRETDLEFVQRLLHEEGIAFTFDHDDDAEVLVLVDANARCPVVGALPYVPRGADISADESIERLDPARALGPTTLIQRDWSPLAAAEAPFDHTRRGHDHRGRERTIFEHDDRRTDRDDGAVRARRKLEQRTSLAAAAAGTGTVIALAPGRRFDLESHPDAARNRRWLVLEAAHRGESPDAARLAGEAPSAPPYLNSFVCVPDTTPLRPPHDPRLARPRVHGPHTALVVGPEGEEIHTDEHGRVRVRFHWDRSDRSGDDCSCWVPVAQTWAGAGWGGLVLPRIGMEVVVQFLDGDPDRPLVVGCVYNSLNTPPYALPDHKTRSTLTSESTPGGGLANQISLEDARGRESLTLRTRRDLHTHAGHDHTADIKNNHTITVGQNLLTDVGANKVTTVLGNCDLTVADGALTTTVATGGRITTIQNGDATKVVTGNSEHRTLLGAHTISTKEACWLRSESADINLQAKKGVWVRAQQSDIDLIAEKSAELRASTEELKLRGDTKISLMTGSKGTIEAYAGQDIYMDAGTGDVQITAGNNLSVRIEEMTEIRSNKFALSAQEKIELRVGGSSIVLTSQGIELNGPAITSTATGHHILLGAVIRLN